MITLLKPLMVNITILFSFTFNANLFFPFRSKVPLSFNQKLNYGMIGALGALFCMFFPIETLGDTFFDFRTMAILILTLYGGWLPGFIVLVAASVARFVLGGHFLYIGITVSLVAFLIGFLFRKLFLRSQYKIVTGTLIAGCYFLLYIPILCDAIRFLPFSFYFIYFLAFYGTFIALIYVVESLIRINKQMEEMVYLDKIHMIGQMAASIAHEIRNPLTTVRGFIQFLSKDSKDEQFTKFSPLILEELDRTNRILTDYLNVAKQEPFNLSSVSISQLIDDCVQLMRPLASYSNVEIVFEKSTPLFVRGDEHHLKQAIMNVIKNGIESITERGTVTINIQPNTSRNFVVITTQDNGRGMTQEQLNHIGLPFFTTKTKGTGLGSMVTNKIIREMNGSIDYESEINKGTTVKIVLPVVSQHTEKNDRFI